MAANGGKPPRHASDPVIRAAFARVLAELRQQAKMKQAEVAAKSGYEEKYISLLERRKHTPTLTAVVELAAAMKLSPVDVVRRVCSLLPKFAHLGAKASDSDQAMQSRKAG